MQTAMRVLIVEDDPSAATLFRHWLRAANYAAEIEHSAEGAMARLRNGWHFELILCDIELPGRSGLEMVRQVRALYPQIPVVLITGHHSAEIAATAISSGAIGFLMKPVDRYALLERLEMVMRWQQQTQQVLVVGAQLPEMLAGCGGSLLAHRAWGHSVYLLPLVDGGKKEEENFEEVVERLGAEMYPGPPLLVRHLTLARLRLVLADVVRSVKPTWIYAPSAADYSLERRAVHDATMSVVADIPTVYCYRSLSSTAAFVPNHFVQIEEQEKAALLGALPGVPLRPLELLPRSPSPTAEAFQVLRTERSLNPSHQGGSDVPRSATE
jgi:CheY-like chemotaxis protein